MANALFMLKQGMVPVPFASEELALHVFINNKCTAQRVGTRKSGHKEDSLKENKDAYVGLCGRPSMHVSHP